MNLASKLFAPSGYFLKRKRPLLLTLVGSSAAAKFEGPMVLLRFAAIAAIAVAFVVCLLLPTVAMPAMLTGTRLTPV